MIPAEIERVWTDYLAAEQVRIRQGSLATLDSFIERLVRLPVEEWHPWARQLAQRLVDECEGIPVRLPLLRAILFQALLAGIQRSVPGSARWLAGFAYLLHLAPECAEHLGLDQRSEFKLLQLALQHDPVDLLARKRLLVLMRSRFGYALHEIPAMVYASNAASVAECDELIEDLSDYRRIARELDEDAEDTELIAESHFHLSAWRKYLLEREEHESYEEFLSTHPSRY